MLNNKAQSFTFYLMAVPESNQEARDRFPDYYLIWYLIEKKYRIVW